MFIGVARMFLEEKLRLKVCVDPVVEASVSMIIRLQDRKLVSDRIAKSHPQLTALLRVCPLCLRF
jgi:hypothetical protein